MNNFAYFCAFIKNMHNPIIRNILNKFTSN